MRLVVQRVRSARVTVGERITGEIGPGLLVLLGIERGDSLGDVAWLSAKLAKLRIFHDEAGMMNRSLLDLGLDALVVSQFTLIADCSRGTRPSFGEAARPDEAIPLYEAFVAQLATALNRPVATGEFGADMQVTLVNDGPVTLVLDAPRRS